jgi:hypothetical protein
VYLKYLSKPPLEALAGTARYKRLSAARNLGPEPGSPYLRYIHTYNTLEE